MEKFALWLPFLKEFDFFGSGGIQMGFWGYFLSFSLFVSFAFSFPLAQASHCPTALLRPYQKKPAGGFYYEKEFSKEILREKPHQNFVALNSFQRFVKHKTSVDPYYLLKKQLEFYRVWPKEKKRFEKVIDRRVGRISDIGCLEALLLDAHLARFKRASEFAAYVLTHPQSEKIRVLMSTQNKRDGVEDEEEITKLKRDYLRQGWVLELHLHNHPFSFDNSYGDISGTVLPSDPDIQLYRRLFKTQGLKRSLVTNGFSTLELKASEFSAL